MARQMDSNSMRVPPTGTVAHGIGSGEFTFSSWVYADSFTLDSIIISGGVLDPGFYCNSSGNVVSYFGGAGTTFSVTLSTATWYHLMFSRVSNTLSLYIDGSVDATTQNVTGKSWSDNYFLFGADSVGGGDAWNGPIAEYAIWKGVGFGADVALALSAGESPSNILVGAGSRVGYWPMVGSGSSSADEIDVWGANDAHPNINAAYVAHPRIHRRTPRVRRFAAAAGGGAPFAGTPTSMLSLMGAG